MEDNPDSLLDKSDLIFVNPVGTGYSAAVAPKKNRDFWGVDQDADSIAQFIKRYLTKNNRWNSPKYPVRRVVRHARDSCVVAYRLHEGGVDLNGITLQSSILDYTQAGNPVGALPTAAADAWYHKKLGIAPRPTDLDAFAEEVAQFARTALPRGAAQIPDHRRSDGPEARRIHRHRQDDLACVGLDIASYDSRGNSLFLTTLLKSKGLVLGAYDGRVTAIGTGIAGKIDPNSGGNDPTMTAVSRRLYDDVERLSERAVEVHVELGASRISTIRRSSSGTSATSTRLGAQKGVDDKGNVILYTAGDLAAVMALNPDLKVLSANGFYDFVTPFYQTVLDLQQMPLLSQQVRQNLSARFYPSGHMIYLDGGSRTALKADLAHMYDSTVANTEALSRIRALQARTAQ